MHRNKGGRSKQRGFMYGGRFTYDRIRRSALYWGGETQWACGTLSGHNVDHDVIRSRKQDFEIEGRFGYTWKKHLKVNFWITPFIGGGYFEGVNKFVSPSPLDYKTTNTFPYLLVGFLWCVEVNPCFSLKLNFKTKYSVGAKSKISDDPDPDLNNEKLLIEDKFSYNVDLPLRFNFCYGQKKVEVSFAPFYHFRHYGTHENFPFDFIDTKFHMYGARLLVHCLF